jgi:hypothetical protein
VVLERIERLDRDMDYERSPTKTARDKSGETRGAIRDVFMETFNV